MTLVWDPAPLDAAIERGFAASLPQVAAEASAVSGSHEATAAVVQTSPTTAELKATGRIGAIREEGAQPHEIDPGQKGYLYIGGGKFVSGAIHHPGSPAVHYLDEAASRWVNGGFQSTARASLAEAGFA